MQKARGQTKRRPKPPPILPPLVGTRFQGLFTRHLAYFSPFPHGTGSLSVTREYLALEGGPPSFPQDYTCPAVLGIPLGVSDLRVPGCHRLWRGFPNRFGSTLELPCRGPTTPAVQARLVWAVPRSLAATRRIAVAFFSTGY